MKKKKLDEEKEKEKGNKEFDDDGDLIICRLSDKRRVTIQEFKGKTLVSIREYYKKDGKDLPTSKAFSMAGMFFLKVDHCSSVKLIPG